MRTGHRLVPAAIFLAMALQNGHAAERVTFTAVSTRATSVVFEPILVRLAFRAPADAAVDIVPPLPDLYDQGGFPISFEVWTEGGERLRNGWANAPSGYEPVAFGPPWWIGRGHPPLGQACPHSAWHIPAGGEAAMWLDLGQFYPIDAPGTYTVKFVYRPKAGMVSWRKDHAPPWAALTAEELTADAGQVTVVEPSEADRAACEELKGFRRDLKVVMSTDMTPRRAVMERYPDSVYAPYATFVDLCEQAMGFLGPPYSYAPESTDPSLAMGRFVQERPDFPLNHRVATVLAFPEWNGSRRAFGMRPTPELATEARLAELRRTTAELRRLAAESGDYELMARVENRIWYAVAHLAQAGIETGVEPIICPGTEPGRPQ